MTYAKGTKVSIGDTETQIKTMLRKAGADAIGIAEEVNRALVVFRLNDRNIKFVLPLPGRHDDRFTMTRNRYQQPVKRAESVATEAWIQASRERWRQLHLCIKAKLESVEQNIETFDEAFLAHVQMPDGETIGEHVIPKMAQQLTGGPIRPLLTWGGGK